MNYARFGVLLVGVIMIVLGAFGIQLIPQTNLAELGIAVSFASFLVPAAGHVHSV